MATTLREGKLWIQTSYTLLPKLTLNCILPMAEGLSKYMNIICMLAQSAGCGCRIHRLHLWRGLTTPTNKWIGYNTKLFDREAPALELWITWSKPSFPSLTDPLCPRVVAPDRVLSMDQIELFEIYSVCKQITLNWIVRNRTFWPFNYASTNGWCLIELLVIHSTTWNNLKVCK